MLCAISNAYEEKLLLYPGMEFISLNSPIYISMSIRKNAKFCTSFGSTNNKIGHINYIVKFCINYADKLVLS